jgi:fatty-acid desaturase
MESGGYMGDLSMRNQDLCLDKLGQPTGYVAWYLNSFCHKMGVYKQYDKYDVCL